MTKSEHAYFIFSEYSKTMVVSLYSAYFSYVLMGFATFFGNKNAKLSKYLFLGVASVMLLFSVLYGAVMTHNFRTYLARAESDGQLRPSDSSNRKGDGVPQEVLSGWKTHVGFHIALSCILLLTLFIYVLSFYFSFL